MSWPGNRLLPLTSILGALSLSTSSHAQTCVDPRPDYGSAEPKFYDSASGAVRVHFALTGAHAPPAAATLEEDVPDAVVIAAEAADAALAAYGELGFEPPLTDAESPCADNGGSGAVDVYLRHFSAADGQAGTDHCETRPRKRCAGFVLVENDFRAGGYEDTAEGLRTVVPHEVFHLVQRAYASEVERWWAEGSAQWAAKQVYPELRDLERFLPAYFDVPWRPLDVPPPGIITNFLYATAIWPVFLHERFDADLVREVFERLADTDDALSATDAALQARGRSLAEAFSQFAAYNAATGSRAPETGGYRNASDYPEVPVSALPSRAPTDTASGLAAFYYSVPVGSPELRLEADPDRVAALLIPMTEGRLDLAQARPLPARAEGEAIVVVTGQTRARTDAPFSVVRGESSLESEPGASGCALAAPRGVSTPALLYVLGSVGLWRFLRRRKDRT